MTVAFLLGLISYFCYWSGFGFSPRDPDWRTAPIRHIAGILTEEDRMQSQKILFRSGTTTKKQNNSWFQLRSWSQGRGIKPQVGFCVERGVCLRFILFLSLSLSFSLCLSPQLVLSLKKKKKKKKWHVSRDFHSYFIGQTESHLHGWCHWGRRYNPLIGIDLVGREWVFWQSYNLPLIN